MIHGHQIKCRPKNSKENLEKASDFVFEWPNSPREGKEKLRSKEENGMSRTTTTFFKSPVYTDWVATFEKHSEVLNLHMKSLKKLMQHSRYTSKNVEPENYPQQEIEETAEDWKLMCKVMKRTIEMLALARETSKGILLSSKLQDKKGLGFKKYTLENQNPYTQARFESNDLGFKGQEFIGKTCTLAVDENETVLLKDINLNSTSSSISDSDSSHTSSSANANGKIAPHADQFRQNVNLTERSSLFGKSNKAKVKNPQNPKPIVQEIRSRPYEDFTTSNPYHKQSNIHKSNQASQKIEKNQRASLENVEMAHTTKRLKSKCSTAEAVVGLSKANMTESEIDLTELQAKLQREILAGEQADERARIAKLENSFFPCSNMRMKKSVERKRRRRSSDIGGEKGDSKGVYRSGKKLRELGRNKEMKKKRKLDECEIDKELWHVQKKKSRISTKNILNVQK